MPPRRERKLALMGYRSVGKSSIVIQFVEQQFVDSYDPTIENTFTKDLKINNQEFRLNIVDTAGQDEVSVFPDSYALDIHGYVLVYSVTSLKSFQVVKIVHDKLLDMVVSAPIILVGNKTDLQMERKISTEEGKKLAQSWNAQFVEVSAKQLLEIQDIFKMIVIDIEKQEGNAPEGKNCIISWRCVKFTLMTSQNTGNGDGGQVQKDDGFKYGVGSNIRSEQSQSVQYYY